MRKFLKNNFVKVMIFLLLIFYFLYFSYYSIKRYQTLNSHYYDLGIFNQVVYNTSQGRVLQMTNPSFFKNMSRLAIHFDPILIFFAPIFRVFNSPSVLLIIQVFVVSLGGLALYKLSYLILKKQLISFLFFILYLLNYQIARALLFDFHPIVLATSFLLFAFYFYHQKKIKLYYFFIFLALLTKEHVGLLLTFLGIFYIFAFKDKRNGFLTFFIGLFFFMVTTFLIIPYFRQSQHFALIYYVNIKDNFLSLFSQERLNYLVRLFSPFFFSFFSPSVILTLPELMINFFSKNANMRLYYFHYQSLIIATLFYSLILGYQKYEKLFKNKLVKKLIFAIFLVINFYFFYSYYPLPFFVKEKIEYKEIDHETKRAIEIWQKTLRDEKIKLATTPKLAPFFSSREFYLNFLFDPAFYSLGYSDEEIFQLKKDGYKNVDYIIIYKKEIGDLSKKNAVSKLYNNLLNDKNFKIIFNFSEIEVFKKIK